MPEQVYAMNTRLIAKILCVHFTYVNSKLRQIGQWKYIVAAALTSAFYQVPLNHCFRKCRGVATPFKEIRVCARSAMGMPGSETALYRVLVDLVEGIVSKIANNLYCGGSSPKELLNNWSRVLQALGRCKLRLAAKETIIFPKSTTILGWK